jgi:hypothetical protein
MAKDNLFLGFGRGSVGDVVFSRINGQQVARARNRSPRNPQSPLQLLQRVVLKTSASAYSLMQDLTNHSFQGFAEGTECQSQFMRRNVEQFRALLQSYIDSGDPEEILGCQETNFSSKYAPSAVLNPYIISEGSLPGVACQFSGSSNASYIDFLFKVNPNPSPDTAAEMTYAQLVQGLGLQQGDQLTIVYLTVDDRNGQSDYGYINGFKFGRFILEPSDGNMAGRIIDSDEALVNPNPKNENITSFIPEETQSGDYIFRVTLRDGASRNVGQADTIGAAGIIVSRLVGGVWQRSPCQLVVRTDLVSAGYAFANAQQVLQMDTAIYSYLQGVSSTLYLNQAE